MGNKPIPSESELRVHKKIHEHDIEIKIDVGETSKNNEIENPKGGMMETHG